MNYNLFSLKDFPILCEYMRLEMLSEGSFNYENAAVKKRIDYHKIYEKDIFAQAQKYNSMVLKNREVMGGNEGIHKPTSGNPNSLRSM